MDTDTAIAFLLIVLGVAIGNLLSALVLSVLERATPDDYHGL